MTGQRPAGRPWTKAEELKLHELIASGVKVGLIARKLKRSPGAIYTRKSSFRKKLLGSALAAPTFLLPSERLAIAHARAQRNKTEDLRRLK